MKRLLLRYLFIGVMTFFAGQARAEWRGVMIDTSRHFPSMNELHALLPILKDANCTVLHLHLTDGPGWRLKSQHYPRLTNIGALRVDKTDQPWNWRETEFWIEPDKQRSSGEKPYGGYYTAEELKTLATEAKAYGITIVPEIDVPGHAAALLTAYPNLACPTNRDAKAWFLGKDVLCISNPQTLRFLDDIIGELCEIFPDSPIHIGCDEVPDYVWRNCPTCTNPQAQRAFYQALVDAVLQRGHEVVAWDELRTTGISIENVTLMCWHDDVTPRSQDVACPYSYCYLDQTASRARLKQWNPPKQARGWQLNLWTETLPTRSARVTILKEALTTVKRLTANPNVHKETPQETSL